VQLTTCGGVTVPSNVVDCDPANTHVRMPVEVVWDWVSDEIIFPRSRRSDQRR
jgi:hypothetical protein